MRTTPFYFIRLGACGLLCGFLLARPALAAAINDYDGDRKSDLAVYDESNGNWTVLFSSKNFESGAQPILGSIGWRAVPGDYDGDGKADIAVVSKTGTWWMLLSGSTNLPVSANFGVAGAGPVPDDYDGDGITDLAYYKKASGEWGFLFSDNGHAVTAQWGGPDFIPAPADFDGDNKADPCLYQESTGKWYVLLSSRGYPEVSATLGGTGYQAVPADYDNDGRADLCVYNKATGEWQILLSGHGYVPVAFTWGDVAYRPVPGDYDGDGLADPMVYADAIPNWATLLSGSGYSAASLSFGGTNWAAAKTLWREDLVFLAFGDSITYGMASSSNGPDTGYPRLVEDKLKQSYDGYFLSVNAGNPGEDTYQGFERFAQTLDKTHPDLVLLMEGTNDHVDNIPFDQIEENLSNMIRIALGRGIKVIIATIPPVISNEYYNRDAQMANIIAFNPRIYAIAANFNIPVAPVFESITAIPGWESSLMNQPSANHPNDAGYQIVRDAFYAPISAGLNAGQY